MFVGQKPNKSGSISVQVIDESTGYRIVKTIGLACDPEEVARLMELDRCFMVRQDKQYSLFPKDQHDSAVVLDSIQTLQNASISTIGPELIFGRLFDEIGFGGIPEPLFRDTVIAGSCSCCVPLARCLFGAGLLVNVIAGFVQPCRNQNISKQALSSRPGVGVSFRCWITSGRMLSLMPGFGGTVGRVRWARALPSRCGGSYAGSGEAGRRSSFPPASGRVAS